MRAFARDVHRYVKGALRESFPRMDAEMEMRPDHGMNIFFLADPAARPSCAKVFFEPGDAVNVKVEMLTGFSDADVVMMETLLRFTKVRARELSEVVLQVYANLSSETVDRLVRLANRAAALRAKVHLEISGNATDPAVYEALMVRAPHFSRVDRVQCSTLHVPDLATRLACRFAEVHQDTLESINVGTVCGRISPDAMKELVVALSKMPRIIRKRFKLQEIDENHVAREPEDPRAVALMGWPLYEATLAMLVDTSPAMRRLFLVEDGDGRLAVELFKAMFHGERPTLAAEAEPDTSSEDEENETYADTDGDAEEDAVEGDRSE